MRRKHCKLLQWFFDLRCATLISFAVGYWMLTNQISFAQPGGTAGAFSRMGYGARGMGMGNALAAVSIGEIATYYNPALAPFAGERTAAATFSLLSLDRNLNFLSYTQSVKPTAGISLGLINQNIGNIDSRDADGNHLENLSTTENQFYIAFANRLSRYFSIGVNVKLLYAKLYKGVSSATVGFDGGVLIRTKKNISFAFVMQDIGSKYHWNSKILYDLNGRDTDNKFATLKKFAVAYSLPESLGVISCEYETSTQTSGMIRCGAEGILNEHFSLRAGLDRWFLNDKFAGMKPSFGFTVRGYIHELKPTLHYAYILEPFSPAAMHVVMLSFPI